MTAVRVEVTSADIARLAGVKPAAVSNWRRRHSDFPRPIAGTDRSPRFDLAEIEEWLATRSTHDPIDLRRRLFQAFDTARESTSGDQNLGTIGLLLFHLRRHPDADVPSDVDGLRKLLLRAERDFTGTKRIGPGVEYMAAHRPEPDLGPHMHGLLTTTAKAARQVEPALLFEELVRHAESTAGPAVRAVPSRVADLMTELAGEAGGEFIDPACGRGQVLLAAARRRWRRVRAQERDPATAWVAALSLAFASDERSGAYVDVHADDALQHPAYPMGGADAVAFAPPVGDRNWGLEELEHDRRWLHGVPPRLESELAWVQHALAQVRPKGRVVALMPPATAERPSGRRIRRSLVQTGAVRAVVSLPAGLAGHHALPLHLWILERPAETDSPAAPVLFVDAEETGSKNGDQTWPHIVEDVVRLWGEFCRSLVAFSERPGRARAVSRSDLLDEDVDLTPRRHLPVRVSARESEAQVGRLRVELGRLIEESRALVAAPLSLPDMDCQSLRFVTVGELAERGAVTVRRPPTFQSGDGSRTAEAQVLTSEDLIGGRRPSGAETVDTDPMRNPPISKGDVLVPAITPAWARRPLARVAGEQEAGAFPGPGIYVLRPDEAAVDPWFLAGILATGEGARQVARAGSGVRRTLRVDPRRLVLPVLSIETQRRYGEELRRLVRLSDLLRSLQGVGDEFIDVSRDHMTGSLVSGKSSESGADWPVQQSR